jgi:hypothetical protein
MNIESDRPSIALTTVVEALHRAPQDLDTSEDEELVLSPEQPEHHQYLARARLDGYRDLQALGLVPRNMPEQSVREAIASDDQDAMRLAQDMLLRRRAAQPAAICNCEQSESHPTTSSFRRDLKQTYREIRRDYHPALANALSEHYRVEFSWDSALAGSINGWVHRIYRPEVTIEFAFFRDITIRRGSTLSLRNDSTVLLARNIRIHREGRLRHRGGYLRIWASAIDSFLDLADIMQPMEHIPWNV